MERNTRGPMKTNYRETGSGRIVFEHRIALRSRLIIGLMLGWFPAFFLYHFVNALIHYIRFATAAEWLSALPGLLVVLVLFLGPGVMVWMVLVGQDRLVVDLVAGQVIEENDLRFYTRRRSIAINNVREVKVTKKSLRTRGHSSQTWLIQLVLADHSKPMRVGWEELERDAQELAQRAAGFLHLE